MVRDISKENSWSFKTQTVIVGKSPKPKWWFPRVSLHFELVNSKMITLQLSALCCSYNSKEILEQRLCFNRGLCTEMEL